MIRKIREAQEREEGFTLIELLVVVIIIGILAAIAIPSFLNQRERGYQAGLTSDVRNAALEIEAQATANNGNYPTPPTGTFEVSTSGSAATTTLTYVPTAAADAFCLSGTRSDINSGANSIQYQSNNGGLQPFDDSANTACDAVAYAGTSVALADND